MTSGSRDRAAQAAERAVRAPLPIAGVVAVALLPDSAGLPGMLMVAGFGVRALLLAYILAGVLNAPRFPRTLRGPPTPQAVDEWLLDLWTAISAFGGAVAIAEALSHGV